MYANECLLEGGSVKNSGNRRLRDRAAMHRRAGCGARFRRVPL